MPRKPTDMSIASWASSRKRIATSSKEILFENGPPRTAGHCPYFFLRVWCRELCLLVIFNPVLLAVSGCRHLRFCTEKPWDFLIEGRGGAPALWFSSGTPHVLSPCPLTRAELSIHPQLFIHPLFLPPFLSGSRHGGKCKHQLCASVGPTPLYRRCARFRCATFFSVSSKYICHLTSQTKKYLWIWNWITYVHRLSTTAITNVMMRNLFFLVRVNVCSRNMDCDVEENMSY